MRGLATGIVLLISACACLAQGTVTNQGYATTPGPALPMTSVSPPLLYPPVVHLDPGITQSQPAEATAANAGVQPVTAGLTNAAAESEGIPAGGEVIVQNQAPVAVQVRPVANAQGLPLAFNFGAAQLPVSPADGLGESLADAARRTRQQGNSVNAHTFTNGDVQKVEEQTGALGESAEASKKNWPVNNGVITPYNQSPSHGGTAAPPRNEGTQAPAMEPNSPSEPKADGNPAPAASRTEATTGERQLMELAESRPQGPSSAEKPSNQGTPANPAPLNPEKQLPSSATKLLLIGVLGLISISAGLLIRFQRETKK